MVQQCEQNQQNYATVFGAQIKPLVVMGASRSSLGLLDLFLGVLDLFFGHLWGLFIKGLFLLHHIPVVLALWPSSLFVQACGLLPSVPALT